ncbi:phosphotransferase [Citricoccus sp. K5]|uniref:phosphotransferase n=1 Tax=Citricoccus sp. K5 TaxID=2653135 RepID=UPI0012F0C8BD|nr:phosphotransferase [Citricoccus sp. K5]VXB08892.1 Aminoglycoside phosphotransferase (APT) family kinase protein [Citricoccus sp. K5]
MPLESRDGEPVITDGLVRALLREQHPDLAHMPLGVPVRGWDNTMVRLGERLALRLPRHAQAESLLDREVAWLPRLASQLAGLPSGIPHHTIPVIPTPVRTGVRRAGYPFRWAVVPWVYGTPAVHMPLGVRDAYASSLAAVLHGLHRPAPGGAPTNVFRGVGVAAVADRFAQRRTALAEELSTEQQDRLDAAWAGALAAAPHTGPALWLHGDPHPNNTVLAGVGSWNPGPVVLVDFGDLCAGDPASDLGAALLHFSQPGRRRFRAAYDALAGSPGGTEPDAGRAREALWARATGWAASFSLLYAAQPESDPLRPLGRYQLG